jgi:hypothetical protein
MNEIILILIKLVSKLYNILNKNIFIEYKNREVLDKNLNNMRRI